MDFDTTNNYGVGFYDTWVTKDIKGQPFKKNPPYVTSLDEGERLRFGKAFPVFCCWNGVLVANAAPFYEGACVNDHPHPSSHTPLTPPTPSPHLQVCAFAAACPESALRVSVLSSARTFGARTRATSSWTHMCVLRMTCPHGATCIRSMAWTSRRVSRRTLHTSSGLRTSRGQPSPRRTCTAAGCRAMAVTPTWLASRRRRSSLDETDRLVGSHGVETRPVRGKFRLMHSYHTHEHAPYDARGARTPVRSSTCPGNTCGALAPARVLLPAPVAAVVLLQSA